MTEPEPDPTPMQVLGRPIITDPYEALEVQDDPTRVYPKPEWAQNLPAPPVPPAPAWLNPASPEYDPAKDPALNVRRPE